MSHAFGLPTTIGIAFPFFPHARIFTIFPTPARRVQKNRSLGGGAGPVQSKTLLTAPKAKSPSTSSLATVLVDHDEPCRERDTESVGGHLHEFLRVAANWLAFDHLDEGARVEPGLLAEPSEIVSLRERNRDHNYHL